MTIRSRMNIDLIGPEHLELFALDLKNSIFHFVYPLASTNINQSAPNLVKIYMTIRSRMSSILGLIGPEPPELYALELKKKKKKCYISLCLHSSIYKYQPISTNLGQNIYDYKISDEFDFGSNRTRTITVFNQ